MSYMGMLPTMTDFCSYIVDRRMRNPANQGNPGKISILEIGVDRGQTSLPLMHNLVCRGIYFDWVGVDIRQDDTFTQQLIMMEGVEPTFLTGASDKGRTSTYIIENSLDFLESYRSIDAGPFDLVLIDGDHNYDTVQKELSYLNFITHELSLVICDDYGGRHANKDDFYERYDTHKNLTHLSTHLDTGSNKGGVTKAVDEFLEQHTEWNSTVSQTEPVVLTRQLCFNIEQLCNVKSVNGKILMHNESVVHTFSTFNEMATAESIAGPTSED